MSEIINNSAARKEMLKHLIERIHKGEDVEQVRTRLEHLLHNIPYNEVVEVEQELIAEGLPEEEILQFCDLHSAVLNGHIDHRMAQKAPAGHPADTFHQENVALRKVIVSIEQLLKDLGTTSAEGLPAKLLELKGLFNSLSDVNKHYLRKEYLLFPYLEAHKITGPPKVMWGKHDETRELLKAAHQALEERDHITHEELESLIPLVFLPAIQSVENMIMKEEEILLPMCLDTLTEAEWYKIYSETVEFGYCLYDPQETWSPSAETLKQVEISGSSETMRGAIRLSSGSFAIEELEALFVNLPVDITFVDANDKVKFFSHSPHRVFERNRSIIGRDVRMCHPPGSVHIVEQILEDFHSGKESRAHFRISNFRGRFVVIDYIALRDEANNYLGVVEITQDITHLRELEGDQRLLSYGQ